MLSRICAERRHVTIEFRPPLVDELRPDGHDDAVVAVDGDALVGHLTSERIDLTVPGGARLTAAAIRSTHVDPERTREGILTGLVRCTVEEARDRGQVLAVVDSPSTTLFDRFGFAMASEHCTVEVDACTARPIHRSGDLGEIETLPVERAVEALPAAYEHCARERCGTTSRSSQGWHRMFDRLHESGDPRLAVHRDSTGMVSGYSLATTDGPAGRLLELVAAAPETERMLWADLLELDDVKRWSAVRRPVDDLARHAVADKRAYRTTARSDGTWLRLLDLDIALGTRTYGSTISNVTIRIDDPWFHANSGTWRIDSYGSFRSQTKPDLSAGIAEFSAIYLGGVSWRVLRDAGRIVEHRAGAAVEADVLFGCRPHPFDLAA